MHHATLRRLAGPGALACALLVSGCGLLSSDVAAEDETATEAGIISEAKATADRLLTAARDQLGIPAASPTPRAPEPHPLERPAPARATRTAATAAPAAARAPEQPVPAETREAPLAFAPVPALPAAAASAVLPHRAASATIPARPATLYSSTDAGVEPPAWRSATVSAPQLTGSGRHLPALELIVDTDGSVERARLLQGSRQLPDMMILSSAKMWRFEPARLDGEPVRYRLVVRLNEGEELE